MRLILENQDDSKHEFDVAASQVATVSLVVFKGKYYTFQYKVHGEDSVLFREQIPVELNLIRGK